MFCKTRLKKRVLAAGFGSLAVSAAALLFFVTVLSFLVPLALSFAPLCSDRFDFTALTGAAVHDKAETARRIFRIAGFTVMQAILSAFLATAVGLAAAYFCAKKKFAGRKFLLALSSIPLCVPAIIVALAFIVFFRQ